MEKTMSDIKCSCGAAMLLDERSREYTCTRYGEPGYDMCTPPMAEQHAAAHRLGPFAPASSKYEPRTWTESMHAPTALEAVRPNLFR